MSYKTTCLRAPVCGNYGNKCEACKSMGYLTNPYPYYKELIANPKPTTKVKIFSGYVSEITINDFIKDKDIVDIKFQVENGIIYVLIIYKED